MTEKIKGIIQQYRGSLSVDYKNYNEYHRFMDFSEKLIKTDNFVYRRRDMEDMVRFLQLREFETYSRYAILEMVIRRKTMQDIKEIDRRKGLWLSIDNSLENPKERKRDVINVYSARYGNEEAIKDLSTMFTTYETKVETEFERIKRKIEKTKDKEEKLWLYEVEENHKNLALPVHNFIIPSFIEYLRIVKEKRKPAVML